MINNETSDSQVIKKIIAYLRTVSENQLESDLYAVGDVIKRLGAKRCDSGCYATVYRVGKFCIKLVSNSLNKLRTIKHHPLFKKFAPTIYWMHNSGRALVCKFVEFIGQEYANHHKIRTKFKAMLDAAGGFEAWDLHAGNLVRVPIKPGAKRTRWLIIDYGSWVGE